MATPEIAALERKMWRRVNADRAAARLAPLKYDEQLADIGRAHSLDMRDNLFFAHESPNTGVLEDRIDRAGYLALEMRENLAQAPDVQRAEDNLLESPGHHANIMAPSVTHLGVGIVRGGGGDERVLTITQVFAAPVKLDTPEQARGKALARVNAARGQRGLPPMAQHELLAELAETHMPSVPDGVPEDAIADIAEKVSDALNGRRDHGLRSIGVAAQGFFSAQELVVPSLAMVPSAQKFGLATSKGFDKRGRPRVKLLLLIGQIKQER